MADPAQQPLYLDPALTTFAQIRARLRADTQLAGLDLREGSWEGDVLDAAAMELDQAAILARNLYAQLFAVTATGTQLDVLARMRASMMRLPATPAVVSLVVTGAAGAAVPLGARFATSGAAPVYFRATAPATVDPTTLAATVPAQAEQPGAAGNVAAGTVDLVLPAVPGQAPPTGLLAVTNPAPATDGLPQETDAQLRTRYLYAIQRRRTAGNGADYDAWAREVPGVGDVVVLPTPVGAGSVGVSLLGDDLLPASPVVVAAVQQHIMPASGAQTGVGSIGPRDLRIYAAPTVAVAVAVTLTYDATIPAATINAALVANVQAYLRALAFATQNAVQPDHVGVAISDTPGVVGYDLATLRVNGGTSTVAVAPDALAVLGGLVVNGQALV